MYTSAFLTPSKESTLARTKSIMNTFSPKSTNINTGDASQTTTVVEQITGRKPYLLVNLPRIMQELSSSSFLAENDAADTYLSCLVLSREEAIIFTLAHELWHVFQEGKNLEASDEEKRKDIEAERDN
jgi:hypothetical protein